MGFLDSIFGSSSSSETSFRPVGRREKQLQQLGVERAEAAQPLFMDLLGQSRGQQSQLSEIFGRGLEEQQAFNALRSPEDVAQTDLGRLQSVENLGGIDQDILERLLALSTSANPDQVARIAEIADRAISGGLSDLGRFRDETFESFREQSAARGLRPTDTPILNQFGRSSEEFGRQAQQLINSIRQQQLTKELSQPLAEAGLGLSQLTSASDVANRRRVFESNLQSQAEARRLGLGASLQGQATGLATGSANPSSVLQSFNPLQVSGTTVSQTPSAFSAFKDVAQTANNAAGPLAAIFSDERVKKDIEPIEASRMLDGLGGFRFLYRDPAHGEGEQIGIMAQDLQRIGLGQAVVEEDGILKVDTTKLVGPMMAFVSDLNRRMLAVEGVHG